MSRDRGRKKKSRSAVAASSPEVSKPPNFFSRFRISAAVIGTIVACAGLALSYVSSGADELREKVYKPVFSEFSKAGLLVEGVGLESFNPSIVDSLAQAGDLARIPSTLQRKITATNTDLADFQSGLYTVTELVEREISKQILGIRSEAEDRNWINETSKRLRTESEAQPGLAAIVGSQMAHSGRSRALDVRDPHHPIVAGPGGPTWNFNDWAGYPETLKEIERLWTEDDFLYFDPLHDQWYYRVTRADFREHGSELRTFLGSVHDALTRSPVSKHLLETRPNLSKRIKALTAELSSRVQEPRRLSDIIFP